MFKFRFFSLVVISMMLIVGLSASSVLAKPGGVKVDEDAECDDSDRETNYNPDGCDGTAFLWLSIASGIDTGTLTCSIDCGGSALTTCTLVFLEACAAPDDEWESYYLTYDDPGTIDERCTITVSGSGFKNSNQVISKDSWLQECS